MTTIDDQLTRLGEKLKATRETETSHRAAAWQRIQTEAPELAELMREVARVFGRPASVRIKIDGERVL